MPSHRSALHMAFLDILQALTYGIVFCVRRVSPVLNVSPLQGSEIWVATIVGLRPTLCHLTLSGFEAGVVFLYFSVPPCLFVIWPSTEGARHMGLDILATHCLRCCRVRRVSSVLNVSPLQGSEILVATIVGLRPTLCHLTPTGFEAGVCIFAFLRGSVPLCEMHSHRRAPLPSPVNDAPVRRLELIFPPDCIAVFLRASL
jgi:hypothetical protein